MDKNIGLKQHILRVNAVLGIVPIPRTETVLVLDPPTGTAGAVQCTSILLSRRSRINSYRDVKNVRGKGLYE